MFPSRFIKLSQNGFTLRKRNRGEAVSDEEWSWVPETHKSNKLLVFMSVFRLQEDWIDGDLYSKAIDNLDNQMKRIGNLENGILDQIKTNLHKDRESLK